MTQSQNGEGLQGNAIAGVFDSSSNSSKWLDKFTLGAGQEQEISVILDWNRQGVQKDWSLTAWGTGGLPVKVSHTDSSLSTDMLPQVGKTPRSAPTEIEVSPLAPILKSCRDTDNGATDRDGDACVVYNRNPAWCGGYDDGDFKAKEMCCVCDGGSPLT